MVVDVVVVGDGGLLPGTLALRSAVRNPTAAAIGCIRADWHRSAPVFFRLNTWELALVIVAIIGAGCAIGAVLGRHVRRRSDTYHEPLGVLQGALLGVVGLVLAFGLSLALGRYENRRADVVAESNAIGTAYLRAQTIAEPQRSRTLAVFPRYTDLAISVTYQVPGSDEIQATTAAQGGLQRQLWRLAGQSMNAHPVDSAPRLYLDSLNEMFDDQSAGLAGLNNRVPNEVLLARAVRRRARRRRARALPLGARERARRRSWRRHWS